jgi:hypothetical protein
MATVNNKEIVDQIIANDGFYDDEDPRVIRIVQYENQWNGAPAYGLIYVGENPMRYHESLACINPKTIWDAEPFVPKRLR